MAGLRRKMDSSEEGVATTVGTIMALLIFLSILSLITQQYVPVWMEENEAYHMDEVKGQFADLKGNIDRLIDDGKTDRPLYSSVNLGTAGVPLFAGSSPGRLSFSPRWGEDDRGGMSLSFIDGGEQISFKDRTGNISYHAINREFEDQTLIYEHGAIILEQSDGEIMRAKPHISIDNITDDVTDEYEVSMTMIDLTGSSRDLAGASRVGITTELNSYSSNTFDELGEDPLYLNMTTAYQDVWKDYFRNQTDVKDEDLNLTGNTIKIELSNVTELKLTRVDVEIKVSR